MEFVNNCSNAKILDSIIVSQLPTMLMADLKTLMLGHFANFGRILRISCPTKGGERIAHIQFSSSEEALKALKNGNTVNGHKLAIEITDKHPSTQLISTAPRPNRSTLASSNAAKNENKGNIQSTLSTYFQRTSSSASANNPGSSRSIPTASSILDEAVIVPPACPSTSASVSAHQHPVDRKPNTCVKLEVYQGPPGSHQSSQAATNTTTTTVSTLASNSRLPVRLRPTLSLREILNVDTSRMKMVKTVSASDALACQYFTGGRHPFPLAMMFGKIPGSVIMPIKSMMNSIKPGMEIKDSTTELVWNTILQSVLKTLLPQSAKSVLRESIIDQFALKQYMQLEEDIIGQELDNSAEREFTFEEDVMICCEDVMDEMLGLVCSSLIVNACSEEIRISKVISRASECCFRKLTDTVVQEAVNEMLPGAMIDNLCEELLEDVLESPIFSSPVRAVAAKALKNCRDESEELRTSTAISRALECCFRKLTDTVVRETVNEMLPGAVMDNLCEELLEDVLESPIFGRHVRVVAAEALKNCRDERKTMDDGSSSGSDSFTNRCASGPISLLPSTDVREFTENWLETSSFDIYNQISDIESIADTDISCFAGSSQSSKGNLSPLKLTSVKLFNEPRPTLTSNPSETQVLAEKEENGFFSFSSLKRKLPTIFSFQISNPFKRRRF